jgi:hypothetical protein
MDKIDFRFFNYQFESNDKDYIQTTCEHRGVSWLPNQYHFQNLHEYYSSLNRNDGEDRFIWTKEFMDMAGLGPIYSFMFMCPAKAGSGYDRWGRGAVLIVGIDFQSQHLAKYKDELASEYLRTVQERDLVVDPKWEEAVLKTIRGRQGYTCDNPWPTPPGGSTPNWDVILGLVSSEGS